MDAVTFTRQLIDIESISGNEAAVGNYLYGELCRIGYQTRKIAVEGDRFNVFATLPEQAESSGRIFHAHGHGSTVHSVVRRCGSHLRARIL